MLQGTVAVEGGGRTGIGAVQPAQEALRFSE